MAGQIVITEKSSQAKDVRAAVGSRYGEILPAEGHLIDLLEPEDVVPEWKRWSPILLRPEGLYGTRPSQDGNKAAKLRALREAMRRAKRVLFTAQDQRPIRGAVKAAKPSAEDARLYAAAVARRQADQIYNLSLTRTATVILGRGARGGIGGGRVRNPTRAVVA